MEYSHKFLLLVLVVWGALIATQCNKAEVERAVCSPLGVALEDEMCAALIVEANLKCEDADGCPEKLVAEAACLRVFEEHARLCD